MKKRTSLGLVALFTAVTLLLTMNLQFEHLKVLPPRIYPPFAAFLCFSPSFNADVGGGVSLFLPRWMCGSTNLSCLRRYMWWCFLLLLFFEASSHDMDAGYRGRGGARSRGCPAASSNRPRIWNWGLSGRAPPSNLEQYTKFLTLVANPVILFKHSIFALWSISCRY